MLTSILKFIRHVINASSVPEVRPSRNNLEKDYSLKSGERQAGRTLEEIRKDHTVRYELAADLIGLEFHDRPLSGLDLFCGNGYGTYLLANKFPLSNVLGIDGSSEAIDLANECYLRNNNRFEHKLYPFQLSDGPFDFVTCFESLEHVEEDQSLLLELFNSIKTGGLAIVSVPNQDLHPLEKNPHHFHFRHYRHEEFISKIAKYFTLEGWYGQNVYEFTAEGINTFNLLPIEQMILKKETPGQVNVYVLRKSSQM